MTPPPVPRAGQPGELARGGRLVVVWELTCSWCGYPLQGVSVTAGCPECGGSVYVSLRGRPLLPPVHTARILRGAYCLMLGSMFGLLLTVAVLYGLNEVWGRRWGSDIASIRTLQWLSIGAAPGPIVLTAGWLLLAVPPADARVPLAGSLGRFTWWLGGLASLTGVVWTGAVVMMWLPQTWGWLNRALSLASVLSLVTCLVGGRYLGTLAEWCGRHASRVAWLGIAVCIAPAFPLALSLGTVGFLVSPLTKRPGTVADFAIVGGIMTSVLMIFGAWFLNFRNAMRLLLLIWRREYEAKRR